VVSRFGGTTLGQGSGTHEGNTKGNKVPRARGFPRLRVAACRGITKGNCIETTTTNLERKTDDTTAASYHALVVPPSCMSCKCD